MPDFLLDIFFRLFVIGLLLFANAFFVVSEYALVNVRKTRIQQLVKEKNTTAQIISEELANIPKFIAAVQVGVTVASIGLGWVGQLTFAELFYPLLAFLPQVGQVVTTHTIAALFAFIIITTLQIIFSELIPKAIALQYPETTSFIIARPMKLLAIIFSPFILFLNNTANSILKLLNIPPAKGVHLVHSTEELDMLINASYQEGVLNETERDMLHNVFKFSDLIARQIMVPRPDVVSIPLDIHLNELMKFVYEHQFTRYPVYENDLDNVLGIIHIKDVIPYIEAKEEFALSKIIRKVMLVPETLTIDKLLLDFKRRHSQMAVVIDEFGGTSGIVTLEDVLEEIFGDVQDEFDIEEADVKVMSENEYIVNAMLRIDEVNEIFDINLEEEEIETIGGFILKELGRVATVGDQVRVDDYIFIVENVEGARITKLKIQKIK
ncbi:MAG: hypothetical protein ACD_20C00337G0012 [uncultured bacterium]|nr:MAG: hypothetical protein ACD_20C00337G0012 [uncultured bacterium]HBH18541.1 HlyC/CorC family transporter [Cyanobacteria bacterium UBA9579]